MNCAATEQASDSCFPQAVTVETIAKALGAEVHGERTRLLSQIKPLESATSADLSFLAPTSKRKSTQLFQLAEKSKAGAILVPQYEKTIAATQIITPHPLQAVMTLAPLFLRTAKLAPGVHPLAVLGLDVELGQNIAIGALAVIGDGVLIGESTVIHPHAVIYQGVTIGKNCIIHAGAVIREFVRLGDNCVIQNGVVVGGDGFGYQADSSGKHQRITHLGTAVLEDGVDLGANSTVDRAMLGETRVGAGTKIDNLVMVGHNVKIGANGILCSQVGVSGSTVIGDQVVLGGQVGLADHLTVGNNVRATARSGITRDIPDNTDIGGFPARPIAEWKKQAALLNKLPELYQRLLKLEKRVLDDDNS